MSLISCTVIRFAALIAIPRFRAVTMRRAVSATTRVYRTQEDTAALQALESRTACHVAGLLYKKAAAQ